MAQEKKKNNELVKREKQLKSQIDNLIADSLSLLKRRLDELGIQAKTPPEFIEKAKMIVCNHHELQRNKAGLETEISKLSQAQSQIVAKKEKELIDYGVRDGLTQAEARAQAKRKIDSILNTLTNNNKTVIRENKDPAILGLSAEVIVTKCSADQLPISTQIRKRPRDAIGKQKDWPEKRHKDSPATVSPIKPNQVQTSRLLFHIFGDNTGFFLFSFVLFNQEFHNKLNINLCFNLGNKTGVDGIA